MEDPAKSLTPQRKHRKLLKDGSGTAVWPEAVETVFVQGLREYWDSPWATYSRGRSRWRNQFLVDYLQNLGIVRTKKQVASHIQVLRNMWKGEPEYQLVAGGDELFNEPIKVDEPLLSMHDDDESPENSPPDVLQDFPPSPTSPGFPGLTYSPSSPQESLSELDSPPQTLSSLYTSHATRFTLLADGMAPFSVDLDKLSPTLSPLVFRLRLAIAPVTDPRAPPNLHGFFANVRLARVWSDHARVFTRVYNATNQCISDEVDALQPSSIELGAVVAPFPESMLARARWCDAAVQTTISQQLVVDGVPRLVLVYELDRRLGSTALPSVQLVSYQKYTHPQAKNAKPEPERVYAPYSPQGSYTSPSYSPYSYPYPRHSQPPSIVTSSYTPSLSSALTPVSLRP
ncbi:hypothetical protein FB45DRAFT_912836 [Roridomyces roridus]|uniref:TEA domain-containing protein n=1 Tax=Roridomyces roridus TaxID=1738132 RepID=A0AAD7BWH0_9AGAR|nr:hypothetical protein FB45DRAFT_912836 [Roridomyces roridus]